VCVCARARLSQCVCVCVCVLCACACACASRRPDLVPPCCTCDQPILCLSSGYTINSLARLTLVLRSYVESLLADNFHFLTLHEHAISIYKVGQLS